MEFKRILINVILLIKRKSIKFHMFIIVDQQGMLINIGIFFCGSVLIIKITQTWVHTWFIKFSDKIVFFDSNFD
jgi:hypothetical protein